jgi:hypothetical protein
MTLGIESKHFPARFASHPLPMSGRLRIAVHTAALEIILFNNHFVELGVQDVVGDNEVQVTRMHLELIGTKYLRKIMV